MIKQKRLSTSTQKNSYPQVDNNTPIQYDRNMTNNDLRPPSDWESHEGIRIANRHVYHVDGRTELTPIDYETFKHLTAGLFISRIPKSDAVTEYVLFPQDDRLVSANLLKERIETKIEEYLESLAGNTEPASFDSQRRVHQDIGVVSGLRLALQILEES